MNPAWPENYVSRKAGSFLLLYTKQDESLVPKLDTRKLNEIFAFVKKTGGLQAEPERAVILPPDLESYRKLHAGNREETMNWYPSGFQTKDIIIMWPPSVPRYSAVEGEKYFWDTEIYDILVHELTHLMVGEVGGVFSLIPVWLNEGLAVYVESEWSADSKKYWDVTFDVSYRFGRLLSWDEVAARGTSDYPIAQARIHYAQSYKMVSFLIKKYGTGKLLAYLKSFRTPPEAKPDLYDLKVSCKENFRKVFGVDWNTNLKDFTAFLEQPQVPAGKE